MDKWMKQVKREILAIRLRYKKMLHKLEYITDAMRSIVDSITTTIPEIRYNAGILCDDMFYHKSFKSNEYDSLIGTPNFKEECSGHRILLYVEIKYIDNNDCECDPKDFSKVCKGLIRIYTFLDSMGDDIDSMEILVSYDDTEDCCVMDFYTDEWDPTVDKYDWDESWVEEGETRATFKQEDIDLLASLKSVIRKPKPEEKSE